MLFSRWPLHKDDKKKGKNLCIIVEIIYWIYEYILSIFQTLWVNYC